MYRIPVSYPGIPRKSAWPWAALAESLCVPMIEPKFVEFTMNHRSANASPPRDCKRDYDQR